MSESTNTAPAKTDFTFSNSLSTLNIPPGAYIANHPSLFGLIVGAVVILNSRALLIQRAATDGFPLAWECAGGGVDADDATILHAVGRELREETGLVMTHVLALLDDETEFDGREGRWRKLTFLVQVQSGHDGRPGVDASDSELPAVILEPEEHQDFAWVTEAEVRAGRCDGREIRLGYEAQRAVILKGFRMTEQGGLAGEERA
ncbi:NUDIX hydrolase domain-like protein [Podospora appendiculata]|uniref:NUDIX hydrolase domain-like protein n=1 Tax=Podospora appendiculata TaxID=314037 RepID=A0AAE0XH08_9PEZI|nr:NUDIX hydrolase domain-like protein [Podospora appendiculata]